jgi:hypothetical protein
MHDTATFANSSAYDERIAVAKELHHDSDSLEAGKRELAGIPVCFRVMVNDDDKSESISHHRFITNKARIRSDPTLDSVNRLLAGGQEQTRWVSDYRAVWSTITSNFTWMV